MPRGHESEVCYVASSDARIRGHYWVDRGVTDKVPADWTWRDCGSGPEVATGGVYGPFRRRSDAVRDSAVEVIRG